MRLDEIENFFNKYNISELYLFEIILSYNCELYVRKYKEILNKVRKEKEKKVEVNIYSDCSLFSLINKSNELNIYSDCSLFSLINKSNELNEDELRFLYELVENASTYLSAVQDYSYAYEQIIDDFDINEYPVIAMYKLEESLLKELENRKGKTRQYISTKT